jgi:hypothetical protein
VQKAQRSDLLASLPITGWARCGFGDGSETAGQRGDGRHWRAERTGGAGARRPLQWDGDGTLRRECDAKLGTAATMMMMLIDGLLKRRASLFWQPASRACDYQARPGQAAPLRPRPRSASGWPGCAGLAMQQAVVPSSTATLCFRRAAHCIRRLPRRIHHDRGLSRRAWSPLNGMSWWSHARDVCLSAARKPSPMLSSLTTTTTTPGRDARQVARQVDAVAPAPPAPLSRQIGFIECLWCPTSPSAACKVPVC